MSCNYFIVPTSPDFFSAMSIRSLARVVPTWERWAKTARPILGDAEYKLPDHTPKFLGYTINDFNLSEGQAQRSFRQLMDRISKEVVETLIPSLGDVGMLLPESKYKKEYDRMVETSNRDNVRYSNHYCLAEISNFNKLIALSNEKSIPVFELYLEKAQSGQVRTLKWFKFLFATLADRVIGLTDDQS